MSSGKTRERIKWNETHNNHFTKMKFSSLRSFYSLVCCTSTLAVSMKPRVCRILLQMIGMIFQSFYYYFMKIISFIVFVRWHTGDNKAVCNIQQSSSVEPEIGWMWDERWNLLHLVMHVALDNKLSRAIVAHFRKDHE